MTKHVKGGNIAKAFGADVSTRVEGESLFFVIGHDDPPDSVVIGIGGRVVARLGDPRRVLALAPLAAHAALRDHRELRLAGPVTIDRERFERFASLVSLDGGAT